MSNEKLMAVRLLTIHAKAMRVSGMHKLAQIARVQLAQLLASIGRDLRALDGGAK